MSDAISTMALLLILLKVRHTSEAWLTARGQKVGQLRVYLTPSLLDIFPWRSVNSVLNVIYVVLGAHRKLLSLNNQNIIRGSDI